MTKPVKTQEELDRKHYEAVTGALLQLRKVVNNAHRNGLTVTYSIRDINEFDMDSSRNKLIQELYFNMVRKIR